MLTEKWFNETNGCHTTLVLVVYIETQHIVFLYDSCEARPLPS